MWLLVEAVNIFQSLVTVFISYDSHFVLKRAVIAWGEKSYIINAFTIYLFVYADSYSYIEVKLY